MTNTKPNDLVARLRAVKHNVAHDELCREAAAEIERLTADLAAALAVVRDYRWQMDSFPASYAADGEHELAEDIGALNARADAVLVPAAAAPAISSADQSYVNGRVDGYRIGLEVAWQIATSYSQNVNMDGAAKAAALSVAEAIKAYAGGFPIAAHEANALPGSHSGSRDW